MALVVVSAAGLTCRAFRLLRMRVLPPYIVYFIGSCVGLALMVSVHTEQAALFGFFALISLITSAGSILLGIASMVIRWAQRRKAPGIETPIARPAVTTRASRSTPFDILISYGSRGKPPVRRRITVHEIEFDGAIPRALDAYCHLRKAPRQFIVARIVEMADAETGEVIADPGAWLAGRAR